MHAIDRFFKDKNGRWGIWQKPNTPLLVWGVAQALTVVLPYGQANFVAELIAYGTLFTWAWLELFQGVSLFRRTLGVVIIFQLISSRI
jgi:hypothetical protein